MNELFLPLAVGCAVALVSALMVVLARRPVHSVVALLAHSLSIAALYLILGADMVAMGQVLIAPVPPRLLQAQGRPLGADAGKPVVPVVTLPPAGLLPDVVALFARS